MFVFVHVFIVYSPGGEKGHTTDQGKGFTPCCCVVHSHLIVILDVTVDCLLVCILLFYCAFLFHPGRHPDAGGLR